MYLVKFNLFVAILIFFNSVFATFLWHLFIVKVLKVNKMNIRLITTIIFFILYGVVRTIMVVTTYDTKNMLFMVLSMILHMLPEIGFFVVIYVAKSIYLKIRRK